MDESFSDWAQRKLARINKDRATLGLKGFYRKYWTLAFLAARRRGYTEEERAAALEVLREMLGEYRLDMIPPARWRSEIRPALEREHVTREIVERAALFENLDAVFPFTPYEAVDALGALAKVSGNQIRAEWSDRAGRHRDLTADLDDRQGVDSADRDLEADARAEWASLERDARLTARERQALVAFAAMGGDNAAAAAAIGLRLPAFRKRLERISKKIVRA